MNKRLFNWSIVVFISLLSACLLTMHSEVITQAAQSAMQIKYLTQPGRSQAQLKDQTQLADQAQQADKDAGKKLLSDEQLSVYRDFLKVWRPAMVETLNISTQTESLEHTSADGEILCMNGFDAETMTENVLHRFTAADSSKLASVGINLVDRDAQLKEVETFDPMNGVQKGESVETAVRNGYNHGLFSFSEIQFDKTHERAVLTYSFYCGQQCGSGGTVVLSHSTGMWLVVSQCQQWMAMETPSVKRVTKPCETQPFKISA